jgi:hypothetical protein
MAEKLAEFIAALAEHIAYERGWSQKEAHRWVAIRIAEAREEYRQSGSPRYCRGGRVCWWG